MSNTREEGKRNPAGFRTETMKVRLKEEEWQITSVDNKQYLEIEHIKYRILDGGVTDFLNENLVSIGAGLGRELIILIQSSASLKQNYQLLKNKIAALPKGTSIKSIIKTTIESIRSTLNADAAIDMEKAVEDFCAKKTVDPKALKYKGYPVITMGEFVRENKGVCRHHALLLCYILNQLMVDQLLPEGEIHHTRDNITNNAAHVWVMYMPANSSAIYLVDSFWNRLVDLNKTIEIGHDLRGYGLKALANCKRRFIDIEPSSINKKTPSVKNEAPSVKNETPSVKNETPSVKKQGLFSPSQKTDPITTIYQLLNIKLPSEAERKQLELKYRSKTITMYSLRKHYPEIKDICKINADVEEHLKGKFGEKGFFLLMGRFDNMYNMICFLKNNNLISQSQYDIGMTKIIDEMIGTIQQNLQESLLKK